MIQDNMLRLIRLNAGLGNPPEAYYNNMPESANKVIKMGVDFRKSKMSEFNNKMEKVIQQQRRDCESAVINRGPYALADEFLHLQLSPDKWFSLNARQWESHLKKFWVEVRHEMKMFRERMMSMMLRKTTLLSTFTRSYL